MRRFASTVEAALDRAAAAKPNPGRVPAVHRLNRFEYTNAIRDLLALEIDGDSMLPDDESSYGFDNNASVLSLTPALLERYLLAARKIGRLALGDPTMRPAVATYRMPLAKVQDYRESEDLSFGTRGGSCDSPCVPARWRVRLENQSAKELEQPTRFAASTSANRLTSGWMGFA